MSLTGTRMLIWLVRNGLDIGALAAWSQTSGGWYDCICSLAVTVIDTGVVFWRRAVQTQIQMQKIGNAPSLRGRSSDPSNGAKPLLQTIHQLQSLPCLTVRPLIFLQNCHGTANSVNAGDEHSLINAWRLRLFVSGFYGAIAITTGLWKLT